MKCPFCKLERVVRSKVDGFYTCQACGAIIYEKYDDDPNLLKYRYKTEVFRSKKPEVKDIFDIAKSKFEKGDYEVIATIMNRQSGYSLLFGQEFFAVKRKKR